MKKVLFITYDFPYPTNSGGKNRAYHMLKHSGDKFQKYLYSFVRPDFRQEYKKEMEKIGVETMKTTPRKPVRDITNLKGVMSGSSIFKVLYYSDKILDDICSIILEKKIDIVHFESFYTGFYISDKIKNLGAKQIFGTENIEYKLYGEYVGKASFLLRPLYKYQVSRIRKEEQLMYKSADISIAVSDVDASVIKKFGKCEIVRNGVDIKKFKFKKQQDKAKKILFVGNFTYFPNIDAIDFFYNNVFKKMDGEIEFTIIGKKANTLPCASDNRVKTIEFIQNIKDAYRDNDIMVAPIRLGGGTNFKILEAMAAGVPVIALQARLEGLDVLDGRDISIAHDASDFLKKTIELLEDKKQREKMSENARKLIEREYSWDIIGKRLGEVWNSL